MPRSIFAMELCFPFQPGLHESLRSMLASPETKMGAQAKWQRIQSIRLELALALPTAERGCWDYFDDDSRAQNDFRMWVRGMLTDETARTSPSGPVDVYRGEPRSMTFTMAFLIVKDSYCDQSIRTLCDIPEPALWKRVTFAQILGGLGTLNFASIQSEVLYLIPRDADWALTADDMSQSKFEYLRPIID